MKVIALSLCALAFASEVRADELSATLGEPMREVSHIVDVSFNDGLVTFEVERAFHNAGKRPDEVQLLIDLPPGAVASGLRIQGAGVWYEGELLERQEAARRYEELTGMGAFELKDPALLSWVAPETLSLQVFPVKAGQTHRVAYTLVAPADYVDGRYRTFYPERTNAKLAPLTLRVDGRAQVQRDELLGDPEEQSACGASDVRYASIAVPPPHIPITAARYGTFALGADRELWRFEADAAPHIGEVPRDAHVVLVLDESHSQGHDGVVAQAALARAYLSHFPRETLVEVVWYARQPRREHGRFVSLAQAKARLAVLQARPMARRNGSDIVAALAETGKILSDVSGARRVLLMTDELLATRFRNEDAIAALQRARPDKVDADLVLHIVARDRDDVTRDAEPVETRADEDRLASISAAFGGMTGVVESSGSARALAAVALPYARPVRIDSFVVEAAGLDTSHEPTFEEGSALRFAGIASAPPSRIKMSGKIWGRPWQSIVEPGEAYTFRTAALAFGDDLLGDLSEAEQARAAAVGVVSPVTSYLAIEPGVRPSTEGIPRETVGFGCVGSAIGFGLAGDASAGAWGIDPNEDVLAQAASAAAEVCRAASEASATSIVLEATLDEVVDITPDVASPFARCVVERLWAVRLTSDAQSAAYTVHVQ